MRISDWSSDVCSSDLCPHPVDLQVCGLTYIRCRNRTSDVTLLAWSLTASAFPARWWRCARGMCRSCGRPIISSRSEEHTSELQSLMRISYAVFCLKKKNKL